MKVLLKRNSNPTTRRTLRTTAKWSSTRNVEIEKCKQSSNFFSEFSRNLPGEPWEHSSTRKFEIHLILYYLIWSNDPKYLIGNFQTSWSSCFILFSFFFSLSRTFLFCFKIIHGCIMFHWALNPSHAKFWMDSTYCRKKSTFFAPYIFIIVGSHAPFFSLSFRSFFAILSLFKYFRDVIFFLLHVFLFFLPFSSLPCISFQLEGCWLCIFIQFTLYNNIHPSNSWWRRGDSRQPSKWSINRRASTSSGLLIRYSVFRFIKSSSSVCGFH